MSFAQRCFSCSVAQLLSTINTPVLPVLHGLPEFAQIHIHRVGDAIHPFDPLLPSFPPDFNLSQHQGLSNEYALHIRWPKYWSFSCSISPSNEYSGLISFRIDWFGLGQTVSPEAEQRLLSLQSSRGAGSSRPAIKYDYNNKSNGKQVKKTVALWSQNRLLPCISHTWKPEGSQSPPFEAVCWGLWNLLPSLYWGKPLNVVHIKE